MGIEVLHQNESHTRIAWCVSQERGERRETAGRGSNAHNQITARDIAGGYQVFEALGVGGGEAGLRLGGFVGGSGGGDFRDASGIELVLPVEADAGLGLTERGIGLVDRLERRAGPVSQRSGPSATRQLSPRSRVSRAEARR